MGALPRRRPLGLRATRRPSSPRRSAGRLRRLSHTAHRRRSWSRCPSWPVGRACGWRVRAHTHSQQHERAVRAGADAAASERYRYRPVRCGADAALAKNIRLTCYKCNSTFLTQGARAACAHSELYALGQTALLPRGCPCGPRRSGRALRQGCGPLTPSPALRGGGPSQQQPRLYRCGSQRLARQARARWQSARSARKCWSPSRAEVGARCARCAALRC